MDVKIGIAQSAQVIEVEVDDGIDREKLKSDIDNILSATAEGAAQGVFWLTDRKGRDVAVPAARISFIEVGSAVDERRIGFGA